MFRLALLQNYDAENLVYKRLSKNGFNWEAFTNFIHGANIVDILKKSPMLICIFIEMQMPKLFGQI